MGEVHALLNTRITTKLSQSYEKWWKVDNTAEYIAERSTDKITLTYVFGLIFILEDPKTLLKKYVGQRIRDGN